MNISPHFAISEVSHSNYAILHGIDNTMPDAYFSNAQNLARYVLEPIRMHFGIPFSPESWYRCERLNNGVGGAKNSDHLIAAAADLIIPKVSLMALAEYVRDNLDFDQLILEKKGMGWVHVSYKRNDNRREVLRNEGDGIYLHGLSDK